MTDRHQSADRPDTRAIATAVFHDASMTRWFVVTQQDWPAADRVEPVELVWGCLVDAAATGERALRAAPWPLLAAFSADTSVALQPLEPPNPFLA